MTDPMRATLDDLSSIYRSRRAEMSERAKAEAEREIWRLAKNLFAPDKSRTSWLRGWLGVIEAHCHARDEVLSLGKLGEPLWTAIESGQLDVLDSVGIINKAHELGQGEELGEALLLALEDYTTRHPPTKKTAAKNKTLTEAEIHDLRVEGGRPSAKIERGRSGTAQPKKNPAEPAASSAPAPAPAAARKPKSRRRRRGCTPLPDEVARTRELRGGLRSAMTAAIDAFLASQPSTAGSEYLVNKARREFLEWLDTGLDNFFRDVKRAGVEESKLKLIKIGRVRFWQACEVFSITKLGGKRLIFGHKLDKKLGDEFAKMVRTRHHKRSAALHPDRIRATQGRDPTEEERAEYQAVQDAREVLEEYIRNMSS